LTKEKSEFLKSLEKELKKHWEETKEEREKTHTSNLRQKKGLKISIFDKKKEIKNNYKNKKKNERR